MYIVMKNEMYFIYRQWIHRTVHESFQAEDMKTVSQQILYITWYLKSAVHYVEATYSASRYSTLNVVYSVSSYIKLNGGQSVNRHITCRLLSQKIKYMEATQIEDTIYMEITQSADRLNGGHSVNRHITWRLLSQKIQYMEAIKISLQIHYMEITQSEDTICGGYSVSRYRTL
jgi:hypothetical protein